jgi:hypothetical protein
VGVRLWKLTRSELKGYRPPWRNPCPSLCYGEFVLEVTISLSEQFSGKSNLKWNLQLFQSLWGICKKLQQQKVIQIGPSISTNFPGFSNEFWTPNKFSSNSKLVCSLNFNSNYVGNLNLFPKVKLFTTIQTTLLQSWVNFRANDGLIS